MTARRTALSVAVWVFGLSLSVLFISLWGRAVVLDTESLGNSLAPMSRSGLLTRYLADWMAAEMVESGAPAEVVEPLTGQILASSQVGASLDRVAIEMVTAAASPDSSGSSVDVRSLIAPAIPEVVAGLDTMGVGLGESQVTEWVQGLDPLVIRAAGSAPLVGFSSPAASHLGTATLLSVVTLALSGWAHLALSPDRVAALRGLVTRIAVAGLSFGVMLRLGSWVLDPHGGRAPMRETLAALAGSKWLVPFRVGLIAALAAVALYVGGRLLKRAGVSPLPAVRPRPRPERVRSRSGSS